jgi:hypothetical protein
MRCIGIMAHLEPFVGSFPSPHLSPQENSEVLKVKLFATS